MKFTQAAGANPTDAMRVLGRPTDRIEGPLRVTGRATYAAKFAVPGMVHGVIVTTTIASGRIVTVDDADALAAPGVLAVVTHANAGPLAPGDDHKVPLLAGRQVDQFGQAAALFVADTFEAARAAGGDRRHRYDARPCSCDDGTARLDRLVGRLRADAADREPDGRLGGARHGEGAGHAEGKVRIVAHYIGGGSRRGRWGGP